MLDTSVNFKKNNGALSGVCGFRNDSLFYKGVVFSIYGRFYGKYREIRNTTLQYIIGILPNSYEIFPFVSSL